MLAMSSLQGDRIRVPKSLRRLILIPVFLTAVLAGAPSAQAADTDFQQPATSPEAVGAFPAEPAIGDVNGDGFADAIMANSGAVTTSIMLGGPLGDFTTSTFLVNAGQRDNALGKSDADSNLDIYGISAGSATTAGIAYIAKGTGAGTFAFSGTAPVTSTLTGTASPVQLALGRFNADGIDDVAIISKGCPTCGPGATALAPSLSILLGNGAGGFTSATATNISLPTNANPFGIVTGKFDSDANVDIAVAEPGTSGSPAANITVFKGNGLGGFPTTQVTPTGAVLPAGLETVDIDGDTKLDIIAANSSATGGVSVLKGTGVVGGFGAPTTFSVGDVGTIEVAVKDFDGDGKFDVAADSVGPNFNTTPGTMNYLVGDGTGAFAPSVFPKETVGLFPVGIGAGDFDNTAGPDLIVANFFTNPGTANVFLQARPDLSLTKGDAPDPVTVGNNITYTLTATNNSARFDATGAAIVDTLPAGVTFQSASAGCTNNTPSAGKVTCTIGAIARNTSATARTITVTTGAGAVPSVSNSAILSAQQIDPTPANNTANASTTVNPADADLSLTKSGPASVTAGAPVDYTLVAHNGGPANATGVTVVDTLPTDFSYDDVATDSANGSNLCDAGPTSAEVTCTIGAMANGGPDVTFHIKGTAGNNATTLHNNATIDGNEPDANSGNDTPPTVDTTVTASADLSLTKSGPGSVTAGAPVDYTLVAHNGGPSDATGVTVVDTLPTDFSYDDVATDSANGSKLCDAGPTSDEVTCTNGALPQGVAIDVTFHIKGTAGNNATTLHNNAT
ncbi:MAG: hypothetical protein QOG62_2757, partial [Thermoleophilaceae bacterium]|nr:hypothetical protein [Thermoleophilaceae bacterium]